MVVRGTANVTLVPGTPFFVGAQHLNTSGVNASTSDGTVLIQGGALTVNNTVFVGDGTTSTGGVAKFANGTVLVSGGVFAANTVQLGANINATGYFGLSDGQANINNLNGPSDPSSSGTFSFTGGTLKLRDSSIDVTNDGGTFSPGGSGSVGTTAFADKNYTQNSTGTMWIDISSGTFDTISNGAGTASIAGTIHVQTTDSLNVGDTLDVLTATLVALDPSTMVTGTDASGHPFTASLTNSDTTLTLTVTDVPEPTALAGGVFCAAWLLRRRNRPKRGRMHPLRV
jgi:hypothetical protein